MPDNTVNPKEPNQQVICCTSAWQKTTYAYSKLIDTFEYSIIYPSKGFCMGCDYRVPQLHGLITKDYIQKLKLSPSFNETTFATEYLSLWQGASQESWFNFDKMQKKRIIKNPDFHKKNGVEGDTFYLISVDVGRLNDQTIACVFRVSIDKDRRYRSRLVNVKVLARSAQTKTFTQQAIDIKRLIRDYDPREVVIDTNGLTARPTIWRQIA